MRLAGVALAAALVSSPALADRVPTCSSELVVLGAGQDAGAPQIGNADDDGPRLLPSSLALIDRAEGKRYLFDATPAITEQLAALDRIEPPSEGLGIDGVFLTHAHIGHYLGLAYLGREAAGAKAVPVHAMPRMAEFLRSNGPWSQLVELGNIEIRETRKSRWFLPAEEAWRPAEPQFLSTGIAATAFPVPHRDEYSETVGWVAFNPDTFSFLYLPDIDSWEEWEEKSALYSLETQIARVQYAFIDATFWDDNELLDENGVGRDMSEIPHPRVTETMDRLQHLPPHERAKVHFIHYNHTNPIRDPDSAESAEVRERGFRVAREGMRFCLD
ncbi:MBL fold metallo-hydrolase [Erythrobacter sp. HKB08]|uniref:MBL fold metallo-hydrolase n=1 Tax=Erythrobacter sp. HKB08 TaxID=2502843 RepID=UPI001008C452|nr:MBL fold metallo-hydrolase [Erythrobacter sp. HKB08]